MSPIRQKAREIYRRSILESWLIGILTGLLIAGLVALNLVAPGTIFIVFPLLCLPLIFSMHLTHLGLKDDPNLTFLASLRNFVLYFRRPFNSSFAFFMSLLKAVIVFFALEITLSFIAQPIMLLFGNQLNDSIELMNALLSQETVTWNDFLNVLYANNNALLIYYSIAVLPSFVLAFFAFIYCISRSSTSIYLRLRYPTGNPRMFRFVHNYFIARNRMKTFKEYFSLNWPLFVLLLIGAVGGAIGFSFIDKDPLKLLAASLTGAMVLAMFFMPFYICNMEALGQYYQKDYEIAINQVNEMIMKNMEEQMQFNQMQQESLKKAMEDAKKAQEELNNQEQSQGEDENKENE